jgi:chromosomal replication initiation ATPase DnaA
MCKRFADDGFSTSSIARAVGRHHTTVMHALKTIR